MALPSWVKGGGENSPSSSLPSWVNTSQPKEKIVRYGKGSSTKPLEYTPLPRFDRQLDYNLRENRINNTLKPIIPEPKKLGFWEKIRGNKNLTDFNFKEASLPAKVLTSPLVALGAGADYLNNKNKFTGRILDEARLGVSGGQVARNVGYDTIKKPVATGNKLADFGADLVGTGIGFGTKIPGLNASLSGTLDRAIGKPIENKLLQGVSKFGLNTNKPLAKYSIAGLKTGSEFGGLNAIQTGINGGNSKDILKSGGEGFLGGALFGAGGKALGDIGKSAFPSWKTTFESAMAKEPIKALPLQGKFTIKNTAQKTAQQNYDNAIQIIQNHFKTNKLTPEEIGSIKPKLRDRKSNV